MTLDKDLDNLPEGQKKDEGKQAEHQIIEASNSPNAIALAHYSKRADLKSLAPYIRFRNDFELILVIPQNELAKAVNGLDEKMAEILEKTDLKNQVPDSVKISRNEVEGAKGHLKKYFELLKEKVQDADDMLFKIEGYHPLVMFAQPQIQEKLVKFCDIAKRENEELISVEMKLSKGYLTKSNLNPTVEELHAFITETGERECSDMTYFLSELDCQFEIIKETFKGEREDVFIPRLKKAIYSILEKNNPALCYKG